MRSSRLLFALLVAMWAAACASSQSPLAIRIRVVEDTVLLQRNAEGASFDARAVVNNRGSIPLYLVGCGPSAERDINGAWTAVFNPVCLDGGTSWMAAPRDSTVVPVTLYGFTSENHLPRLDPLAEPGRYRLVFYVATRRDPSTGLTSPSSAQRIASSPFVLRD